MAGCYHARKKRGTGHVVLSRKRQALCLLARCPPPQAPQLPNCFHSPLDLFCSLGQARNSFFGTLQLTETLHLFRYRKRQRHLCLLPCRAEFLSWLLPSNDLQGTLSRKLCSEHQAVLRCQGNPHVQNAHQLIGSLESVLSRSPWKWTLPQSIFLSRRRYEYWEVGSTSVGSTPQSRIPTRVEPLLWSTYVGQDISA